MSCDIAKKLKGNSNQRSFLINWDLKIEHCLERRQREVLSVTDITLANAFKKNDREVRFTEDGKCLYDEAGAQALYAKRMLKVRKNMKDSKTFKIEGDGTAPAPKYFLLQAHKLYVTNPSQRNDILYCLVEASVALQLGGRMNPKIESVVKNFYRYIDTISPLACETVSANLGGGPTKRWMKELNRRERVSSVYECH